MRRSELREHIFKLLFLEAFNPADEMEEQMKLYFDELENLQPKDRKYMQEKYQKIIEKKDELDEQITENSSGWKISRMGKADLCILRLAAYEILFDEDVPVKVAINEAVELAKTFGQDESPAFVNGILGGIVQKQE